MFEQVLKSVAVPAIVAAAILIAGWRPWRRLRGLDAHERGQWSTATAFALAFLVSFVSRKWPSWSAEGGAGLMQASIDALRPASRRDWIVYLALAAGGIGLLAALVRRPAWLIGAIGPLTAAATWLLIRPIANPTYALGGGAALCGITLLLWFLLEPLARRRAGPSLPLAMVPLFAAISGIIALTGGVGMSVAMTAGAMAAVCGMAAIIAWLNPRFTFARGATPLLAAVPAAIGWLQAWYAPGTTAWYVFTLPLAAIPLLWLGELPVVTRRPPWVGGLVRIVLAVIPGAAAVLLAMNSVQADASSDLYQ